MNDSTCRQRPESRRGEHLAVASHQTCLALLFMLVMLAGCASTPEPPATLRQALLGLSDRAAALVLNQPAWSQSATSAEQDIVMLLDKPQVDESLGITPERFGESLTRALLASPKGPQVLDWVPEMASRSTDNGNLWLMKSRLETDGAMLTLSDRELLPYRLTLSLRRPGNDEILWQRVVSGAFDTDAL
ncbi:hypothetical protein [Halomonas salinarum]|uniref:hypothetical protein n=1 Tax=Halomonas salinarum TaxID=1158993 RepID=UPI001FD85430|nr:hypothetical protein [Halomonas salinarum]